MKPSRSIELDARRLSVALAFSALAISVSAGAEEQEVRYTMTAITDAGFGHTVTTGAYAQAIERITAPNYHLQESFAAKTNLCVAYTKTGAIGQASDACDGALAELRANRLRYGDERTNLAVALSNRGVIRAVQGLTEQARQDFVEAVELDSGLAAPATNLVRLDTGYVAGTD